MFNWRLHRRTWFGAVLGVWLCAVLCSGCEPSVPEVHPVWPPPPAAPRIVHVKTVLGPADLGKPNLFEAIGDLLSGRHSVTLLRPSGIAVGQDRFLYVTDQELQAVLVMDLTSAHLTVIERAGQTYFVSPVGVAVCGDTLAVSDSALNVIFILSLDGKLLKTLEKPGGFKRVSGLAYHSKDKLLYAVDTLANEVSAFHMPEGKLVRQFGSGGIDPGQFNFPTHVFLDASGRIFVSDSLNFRVQVFDPTGNYLFHVGRLGDASGHMAVPKGVGVDSFGHIYVVDSYFSALQVFDQRGRFLLVIGGEPGDGAGAFRTPGGLAVDSKNRIYVCDSYNNRIQIFQYIGGPNDEEPTAPTTTTTTTTAAP
jgi:DNA-binding beta-propeller fold protein YncE